MNSKLEARNRMRKVMRVHDPDGASGALLEIHLEPGATILDVHAWVIRAGEVESEWGRERLAETSLTSGGYADTRVGILRAVGVEPGDVVAFEASWVETEPFPSHLWIPQKSTAPVQRAELDLQLPANWNSKLFAFGLPSAVPPSQGNHVIVNLSDLPELAPESNSPGYQESIPRVFVRFSSAAEEMTLDTWEKIAGWYSRASAASMSAEACPAELRARIPAGGDEQGLADLAERVQAKLRYVAVELGMQRWIPDRAEVTWSRGYGDCKDKAAVLISALTARGIEARAVLVRTRQEGEVVLDAPDPGQFNHCVVAIAWNGDSTLAPASVVGAGGKRWTIFDPTSETLPLGAISAAIGGAWAVIADPAEGILKLPEATRSKLEIELSGQLSEAGTLSGQLRLRAEGHASQELFASLVSISTAERQARARRLLARRWPTARMDTCRVLDGAAGARGAGISMNFTFAAAAYPASGSLILTPRFYSGSEGVPPSDSVRRTSVLLGEPMHSVERWEVVIPHGLSPESISSIEWHSPEADYVTRGSVAGGRLRLERHFELKTRLMPTTRSEEATRLLRTLHAGDHNPIVLIRL